MIVRMLFALCLTACAPGLKAYPPGNCGDGFERADDGDCQATQNENLPVEEDCETAEDCPLDKCPDGAIACTCKADEGVCVPACDTADDCPPLDGLDFECDDNSICSPMG
jgi:hypothetical protein